MTASIAAGSFCVNSRDRSLEGRRSLPPAIQCSRKTSPLQTSTFSGVAVKSTRANAAGTRQAKSAASRIVCNLVQKVSSKELEALLNAEERKMPLVIDFYATWCGPCILLAQQLEKLAVEYHGTVQFVKVDTDEEYELADQLEIRGLPTLVFVSKDKEKLAKRTEGILPEETLKELIEDL